MLHDSHPNWRGIEYSAGAIARAGKIPIIEADARNLPVQSSSIDFLFTFAALEHVPQVERAFAEIDRVLRPGGIALLVPAWNCRSWTVKKLRVRPYSELGWVDRIGKALIPLREHIAFRAVCSIPGRVFRELALLLRIDLPLQYTPPYPDLSLNERYPLDSDDDAFVSIDAHAALAWFRQRGYECISHPRTIDRLLARGDAVVARKPSVR